MLEKKVKFTPTLSIILQMNEKKMEELELINKTLETNLQNKTNEFNQIINKSQNEFKDLEQKNKVKATLFIIA